MLCHAGFCGAQRDVHMLEVVCRESGFPMGCADSAAVDGRRGSNVYEVNPWLWQFGRGKPRLGGLTVEETAERKDAARDERDARGQETRRRHKADRA